MWTMKIRSRRVQQCHGSHSARAPRANVLCMPDIVNLKASWSRCTAATDPTASGRVLTTCTQPECANFYTLLQVNFRLELSVLTTMWCTCTCECKRVHRTWISTAVWRRWKYSGNSYYLRCRSRCRSNVPDFRVIQNTDWYNGCVVCAWATYLYTNTTQLYVIDYVR